VRNYDVLSVQGPDKFGGNTARIWRSVWVFLDLYFSGCPNRLNLWDGDLHFGGYYDKSWKLPDVESRK
jgi:hypothetical protein